jgi:DNA-binding transcriptional MerR regulator
MSLFESQASDRKRRVLSSLSTDARVGIAEAASDLGTTPRALRYYEETGLLTPSRPDGRIRAYGTTDLRRATSIVRLHRLGFLIDDIATCLGLKTTKAITRRRQAEELEVRLRSLADDQNLLRHVIGSLSANPVSD